MKRAIACAAFLLGVATDAASQATCSIAAFPPGALQGVPGSDELSGAIRLMGEGRAHDALAALRRMAGAPVSRRPGDAALIQSLVALSEATLGDNDAARAAAVLARASLAQAGAVSSPASAHLALGWTMAEIGGVRETRRELEAAAGAAKAAGDAALEATALAHLALLEGRIGGDPLAAARRARSALARLTDRAYRARIGVTLALALIPEDRSNESTAEAQTLAQEVLFAAYDDAGASRQPRELAHALGLLGEMQLARGDARAASATLARAATVSRSSSDDVWRFRWVWKEGMALRAAGDQARGLERLAEAVEILEAAKSRRAVGRFASSTLARGYRRVYYDLADALLADAGAQEGNLERARATLELSRTAELEDFFHDPCLASRSAIVSAPETLDPRAVLIHPVLFDDRIEILVSHRSGVVRFQTARRAVDVAREVQRLRNALERPGSERYKGPAARLHSWLVAPIEAHLAALGATTLVWVPDGALRGLPFAALHDGRGHLVERYAIAVTPVAALTDPRPWGRAAIRASLAGLTVAAQGFPALPGAAKELDTLSDLLGVTALRDARFTVAALQDSLRRSPVNTMHIASHGQFAPEAGATFLVASDGHVSLPQLRAALSAGKLREEPLELIVLSACQTAAGDDRAALGLAGVAIAAGARSALATLWAVSDDSTSVLTAAFYRAALSGKSGRAQALRQAQLALLGDERFAHPFYWSPYVLIGNWM